MAKRKRPTSNKFRERHPREVGKFYHKNDSKRGHPVLVYECHPDEDVYYIQRFSTKPRKGRVLLTHNIDPEEDIKPETEKKAQYLIKRVETVGYDGITYFEKYKNFRVHPDDMPIVKKYQKIKK